jgi:hypothetical protein
MGGEENLLGDGSDHGKLTRIIRGRVDLSRRQAGQGEAYACDSIADIMEQHYGGVRCKQRRCSTVEMEEDWRQTMSRTQATEFFYSQSS